MKTIEDLRAALFATLEGLRDGSVDIDRAKAVNEVSQTIINAGKLEVDYMRQTDSKRTVFIPQIEPVDALTNAVENFTHTGMATRTASGVVHRMR